MLVEAVILDGDERLREVLRQRRDRDARAQFAAKLPDQRAIASEDERRLRWLDELPGFGLLRIDRRGEEQCAEDAGNGEADPATCGQSRGGVNDISGGEVVRHGSGD
jgi:hypothetical protein